MYLSFVIIYGNLLKYIAVTAQLLQNKIVHSTTLKCIKLYLIDCLIGNHKNKKVLHKYSYDH